jgi:hypothetical protein
MRKIIVFALALCFVEFACGSEKKQNKSSSLIWGEWRIEKDGSYLEIAEGRASVVHIGQDALNFFEAPEIKGIYPDFTFEITFRGEEEFVPGGELIIHFIDENSIWFEGRFNNELKESFSRLVKNGADVWIKTGKGNIYHRMPQRNDDEMTPP